MSVTKEVKAQVISEFGGAETNSGDTKVQVALLTKRIEHLTGHFKTHSKDHSSRRGLLKLVGRRRRLLRYLQNNDLEGYRELIARLGIRK